MMYLFGQMVRKCRNDVEVVTEAIHHNRRIGEREGQMSVKIIAKNRLKSEGSGRQQ